MNQSWNPFRHACRQLAGVVACIALLAPCLAWAGSESPALSAPTLRDDFASGLGLWDTFGSPSPVLVGAFAGRVGLLDNRGDGWCDSGLISHQEFNLTTGFTLKAEVFIDAPDPVGCWNQASIGTAKQMATDPNCANDSWETDVWFSLEFMGDHCWGTPEDKRRHAYFAMGYKGQNGWVSGPDWINGDAYLGGWHTLKVIVDSQRIPSFFVDDQLLHRATQPVSLTVLNAARVYVGERSSNDGGGKTYHDWVELTANAAADYHPADTDRNFQLSIGEVTAYGAAWKTGTSWSAPPNPIPIEYVTNAGYIWKSGEAYRYDTSAYPPYVPGSQPGSGIAGLIAASTFAAKLEFPNSTSWDIDAIRRDPAYSDGVVDGNYLIVRGREFKDFQRNPTSGEDPLQIPAGIGLQLAFGKDNSVWVFTDAELPQAYLPFFGFTSNIAPLPATLWYPAGFAPSDADNHRVWDAGVHLLTDWSDRFLTLPQLGMQVYRELRNKGLVTGPLSDVDIMIAPKLSVLNNSGRTVALVLARAQADGLGTGWLADHAVERWWPSWPSSRAGTAEWGFDMTISNPGSSWFTMSTAYGDNGTTQTVLWDGAIHVQHAGYGAKNRYTLGPQTALPVRVTLRHENVWSGNANNFSLLVQADQVTISNRTEQPVVGQPPQPIVRYFAPGWN